MRDAGLALARATLSGWRRQTRGARRPTPLRLADSDAACGRLARALQGARGQRPAQGCGVIAPDRLAPT